MTFKNSATATLAGASAIIAITLLANAANAGLILSGGGLTLVEEGPAGVAGGPAPVNLATGAIPFTASDLGPILGVGFHNASNLNDGKYGNMFSWIGGNMSGVDGPYAAINLGGAPIANVRSIAFGRSNVQSGDPCGGVCTDRHMGNYTLEYTSVANPDGSLVNTNLASTGWQTIGTLDYGASNGPGTSYNRTWERHRFNFDPVNATGIRLIVPGTGIGGGTAVDEIELYDVAGALVPPPPAPTGINITPEAGFLISWNGNNGDNFDSAAPPGGAIVPNNIALASNGATPISSSDLGPQLGIAFHVKENLNDGFYGNLNSWIGADANPFNEAFAGIDFGGLFSIGAVAWGRDNGNDVTDACGGQCTDRTLGTYMLQFTLVVDPEATTLDTGDANTGWQTIGTFEYLTDTAFFESFLRHQFEISFADGSPIFATGFRLIVPGTGLGGTAIDELEAFGQLVSTQPVPEPGALVLFGFGLLGLGFVKRKHS